MNRKHIFGLAAVVITGALFGTAQAQDAPSVVKSELTREQVRQETASFLKTHRWDENSGTWLSNAGAAQPAGIKSRAEVQAENQQFLRNNRWDVAAQAWVARNPAPAAPGNLTRAEVRAETANFLRTHRWDEGLCAWVDTSRTGKGTL